MTAKCSHCGKEFPMEKLRFNPRGEAHIRKVATGEKDGFATDTDMNQLFCPDCYRDLFGES